MEETISLQDLFRTLKKRLALILTCIILATTVAGVVSFMLMTPVYQAKTQILVNQTSAETEQFTSQDIQTNLQLINTYNVIIKSPAILDLVIERLDLDLTASQLTQKIAVESAQNSQVVTVTVQDPDPYRATDIANTTAQVFEEEVPNLMSVDNVNILSPAITSDNPQPVDPNPVLNMAIGAVIGLMLGVGIAFLLEYLDTTIKSEQDVEDVLGMPILGLVSPIPDSEVNVDEVVRTSRRRR
ncbi:YveK family protein [Bhargavaea cecembensis]|nr:Wzz/FepE/Etk N-terminal domain-containing protein [Bhargavaea cecembensis]